LQLQLILQLKLILYPKQWVGQYCTAASTSLPQNFGTFVSYHFLCLCELLHTTRTNEHHCFVAATLLINLNLATHFSSHGLDMLASTPNQPANINVIYPELFDLSAAPQVWKCWSKSSDGVWSVCYSKP